MQRRLVLVLVLATVIGLTASYAVYHVLIGVASQAQATQPVVVAAANMSLADTVTEQHVKLVPWPKASVPPGTLSTIKEAEGRVVRSSVVAGEPLLESKLAPQLSGKGGVMPMLVPDGMRGVTMKVDDAVRESGFVLPNSRVDVLVSMPKAPGSQERISKVILQDVFVLAAGQTVELRDNKPVTVSTVTLALSPQQTERLTLAQTEGRLTLAMRNLRDTKLVQTQGATAATLLSDGAPVVARPAAAPAAAPRPVAPATVTLPPPKIDTHSVAVVRGNKLNEHVFTREGQSWVEKAGK